MEANPELAYKIGKLMVDEKNPTEALDYLTLAIHNSAEDALSVEPQ
jgi:hypothetical protein